MTKIQNVLNILILKLGFIKLLVWGQPHPVFEINQKNQIKSN